jgi:uncharacterized protein (TIRG00374 family)
VSARPRWARWVTGISLAVALVALVYTIRDIGLHDLGKRFRWIGWWWLAVLAMEATITTLDAVAIRSFMSPEQDKLRLRHALLAQLAGRAVNAVTPSGNLGEAIKVSVLVEHVDQSRAVACILLYNVVGFTVELAVVAIAAPIMALMVPMRDGLRWTLLGGGALCALISIGLYLLAHRGILASVTGALVRLRLISRARAARWEPRLRAVDDKLRLVSGARARDRWLGILAVVLSRATSMSISALLLAVVGRHLTLGFYAVFTVGGFAIYLASSLVPMGLGISEGGNSALFRAFGENPAAGVTTVLARRVTLVAYAAIGLVLVTLNETVRRARDRSRAGVAATPPLAEPVE